MDAFAVALCKGLSLDRFDGKKAISVGLYFGIFQAAMPLAGYLLGAQFAKYIEAFDHWIAFGLLALIGGKMALDSFSTGEKDPCGDAVSLSFKAMIPLAIATSIDALAVGISFAFLHVSILPAVTFIGAVTFVISALGVGLGRIVGARFQSKAELAGGIVLVLIGTKILLEHLDIISF